MKINIDHALEFFELLNEAKKNGHEYLTYPVKEIVAPNEVATFRLFNDAINDRTRKESESQLFTYSSIDTSINSLLIGISTIDNSTISQPITTLNLELNWENKKKMLNPDDRIDPIITERLNNGEFSVNIFGHLQGISQMDLVKNLAARMKLADWAYNYSDDGDVRQRGMHEVFTINRDLKILSITNNGAELSENLWKKHGEGPCPSFITEAVAREKRQLESRLDTPVIPLTDSIKNRLTTVDWQKSDYNVIVQRTALRKEFGTLLQYDTGFVIAQKLWDHYAHDKNLKKLDFIESVKNEFTMSQNKVDEKNLNYLVDQIRGYGFKVDQRFIRALADGIKSGEKGFTMLYTDTNNKHEKVTATLHLDKSKTTNMYFFNKFDVESQKPGQQTIRQQTYYINNNTADGKQNYHISLREGANLLAGRSVEKTVERTNTETNEKFQVPVHLALDFKKFDKHGNHKMNTYYPEYGYDSDNAIGKFNIKENTGKESEFMQNIRKGDLTEGTLVGANGQEQPALFSPIAMFKTVKAYDAETVIPIDKQVLVDNQFVKVNESLKASQDQNMRNEATQSITENKQNHNPQHRVSHTA